MKKSGIFSYFLFTKYTFIFTKKQFAAENNLQYVFIRIYLFIYKTYVNAALVRSLPTSAPATLNYGLNYLSDKEFRYIITDMKLLCKAPGVEI